MNVHLLTSEDAGLDVAYDGQPAPCRVCGSPVADADDGLRLVGGPAGADFVHLISVYVASERFVRWYAGLELGGLELLPLDGGMSRIRVTGRARLDPWCGARLEESCPACGFKRYSAVEGWLVDEDSWDGAGFFGVEEKPGVILCTDATRQALEASSLRGAVFVDPVLVRV